jgi:hypothetical protein
MEAGGMSQASQFIAEDEFVLRRIHNNQVSLARHP